MSFSQSDLELFALSYEVKYFRFWAGFFNFLAAHEVGEVQK